VAVRPQVRAEACEATNTRIREELPEWKEDWGNPDCFFCSVKAVHSEGACEDHATMANRDGKHPKGDGRAKGSYGAAKRKINMYNRYVSLRETGTPHKVALQVISESECITPKSVSTNVRNGKILATVQREKDE